MTHSHLDQEETTPIEPANDELRQIALEALRCKRIVNSLMTFACQSKPAKIAVNLNEIIEGCLLLTRKQARIHAVAPDQALRQR